MTKILVLYYSAYGHMEKMAEAVRDGAAEAGAEVTVKRVPELVPEDVAKKSGMKTDQKAPVAVPTELGDYDGVIIGTGTRFGNMTAQMRNFLDQTGPLWAKGALIGKVGSVFAGSATQHGGQESTILTAITFFFHQGMVVAGLPYSNPEISVMNEISGGGPYGASTITGPDGSRMPSANELAAAKAQGKYVAQIAGKLAHHHH